MGRRKGLHITSTGASELVESNINAALGPMTTKTKKNKSLNEEANEYLKERELRIQENQQRLRNLGIKNIANSLTSLAQGHIMKKKTVKQNTHGGDVDFIPDPSDDSEEDYQQVARSVVESKEKHRKQYISPMSMNKVANLTKLRRVIAPNVSQKVLSTSNALKSNRQRPPVTRSEISKGNKGGAERSMDLVDEGNDDDDDIFEGNRVDMEINDGDQHDEDEDRDYSKDEDNIHEQLQGLEKLKSTRSNSKSNSIGSRKRLHITSTVSDELIEDHVDDIHVQDNVEDDQIFESQGHHTSEIQGAPKKVRGYTKKMDTWRMDSTQRIIVTFNKLGHPVGDEGNELVQFLGTLVRMPDHVSIEYSDWRKVPKQNKEDMYSLVKSKFVIHPNETNKIKKMIFSSMGRKWKAWKGSLKERVYDPSLTVNEIVAQASNDKRVNPDQFKKLVTQWFTPEFQRTCEDKRLSRSKMKEPHVSGTKSFARLAHEMAENNGVYPTRGEMYIKTRTRKDGSIVDDTAAHVVASLKDIAKDSTITPGDQDDFTNDDYSKVKGPEKRGYVRLLGRMPAVKSDCASSSDSQTVDMLKSVVKDMAIIIQESIPNVNMSSVLINLDIQVPGIGSLVHNNSLSVNEISSSRSHNDMVKKDIWTIDL